MPEPFSLIKTLQEAGATFAVEETLKNLIKYIRTKTKSENIPSEVDLEKKIVPHYGYLIKWCKQLEFIGLGGQLFNTDLSVDLKYSRSNKSGLKDSYDLKDYNIDEILQLQENVLIEGEPGTGKTTTLKRLLSEYYFTDNAKKSPYSLPILIRLRELSNGENLYLHLCKILGIKIERKIEKRTVKEKRFQNSKEYISDDRIKYLSEDDSIKLRKDEGTNKYFLLHEKTQYVDIIKDVESYYIGNELIDNYIPQLLNENNILLLLDGLDELNVEIAEDVHRQIGELSLKLYNSKIIVTSRFGVGNYAFDNFSVFYIKDLDEDQIESIIDLWLKDDKDFLRILRDKSYYELANRALFLSLLIYIYQKNKNKKNASPLPKSSIDVYNEVLDLFIISWDDDRNIERTSKYGVDFDKVKKKRFLSHVAYYLTYKLKKKEFKLSDLEKTYLKIYSKFNLPSDEAKKVAKEISEHTGLIIQTGHSSYEFSHLVIQEYLCACYILTMPSDNALIRNYIELYPAPLALVIALSDAPVDWLLYLVSAVEVTLDNETKRTSVFAELFRRMLREMPLLERNPKLGIAVMKICAISDCNNESFRELFIRFYNEFSNAQDSIIDILPYYARPTHTFFKKRFNFSRNKLQHEDEELNLPTFLSLIDGEEFRKLLI
jgi:hypothetical protein